MRRYAMRKVKISVAFICGVILTIGISFAVFAKTPEAPKGYPKHNIELIVPFGPGGGSDLFARALAPILEKKLGVSVTVVNRPGANTVVGLNYLISQPADGYTLSELTN